MKLALDGESLSPLQAWNAARSALDPAARLEIQIEGGAKARIAKAAAFVTKVTQGSKAVYGINTGFGKFAEVSISKDQLAQLQTNLIRSHSVGVGPPLERDLVMAMWILRLNTLCRGNSGVRVETVDAILRALSRGFLAVVPSRGSVGASGDLAPSAHAVLALMGEGDCTIPRDGAFVQVPAREGLKALDLEVLALGPKEGLSLINGTQTTTALALKAWYEGSRLLRHANLAAALSIEGLRGSHQILNSSVLKARNHPGTLSCGSEMAGWLGGESEISKSHADCGRVQDPYSLRCAPQVHGAVADELQRSEEVLRREINSSTDNPLSFTESESLISGGNFHAIYTARVSDALASALTVLASISERRLAQAMSKASSLLPDFLVPEGGLNSGFMMAQVTAAALVSECKSLSFPAGVDSIPTSGDREDHVSMGPIAGHKAMQIVEHLRSVLAIEIMAGAQELDLLAPLQANKPLKGVHKIVREHVARLDHDRVLHGDIVALGEVIRGGRLVEQAL